MSTSYVRVAPRIVKQNIEHDGTGAALDAGLEPFAPLGARVIRGPFPRELPDYDASASSEPVGYFVASVRRPSRGGWGPFRGPPGTGRGRQRRPRDLAPESGAFQFDGRGFYR